MNTRLLPNCCLPFVAFAGLLCIPAIGADAPVKTTRPQVEAMDTNVIAIVLGRPITASEKDKLNAVIFGSLREQFAKENQIEPTEPELDAFVRKTEETEKQRRIKMQEDQTTLIQELKSTTLSVQEREEKESRLKRIERIVKRMGDTQQNTGTSPMMPCTRSPPKRTVQSISTRLGGVPRTLGKNE